MIKILTNDLENKKRIEEIIRDILPPSSIRDLGKYIEAIRDQTGCNVVLKKLDWNDFEIEINER